MSSDDAKRIVSAGLQRRQEARVQREKEEKLDNFEQEMIVFCNTHFADAKRERTKQQNREKLRAMSMAKRKEEARKEAEAMEAMKSYGYICIGLLLLSAWTPLPLYAAAALICGLAAIVAAHIYRIYYPI